MKFLNQTGAALALSLAAVAVLGGVSLMMFQKAQDNKVIEGNLTRTQYFRLFERKLTTLLRDNGTCHKNFTKLGEEIEDLKDVNDRVIYRKENLYYGQAVKFLGMRTYPHPTEPLKKFFIEVNLSKAFAKNAERQKQSIRFEMTGEIDENTKVIQNCQFKGTTPDNLEVILKEEIKKLCKGPGVISNDDGKCIIQKPKPYLEKSCSDGMAISEINLEATYLKAPPCRPIITAPDCTIGIKYTAQPGVYECLKLDDIVDKEQVSATDNSQCGIEISAAGKYKFQCSNGVRTVTPSPVPTNGCTNSCAQAGYSCSHYAQVPSANPVWKAVLFCSSGDGNSLYCAHGTGPGGLTCPTF